jgi:hypothetical protein
VRVKGLTAIVLTLLVCALPLAAQTSRPDDISLREYVDVRFEAQGKAVDAALAAAKEAVIKAETSTEKRFENSNEWRNTVETLQRTYMPRSESEQQARTNADKIEALQKMMWIGLGILFAFQFFVGISLIVWKKQ